MPSSHVQTLLFISLEVTPANHIHMTCSFVNRAHSLACASRARRLHHLSSEANLDRGLHSHAPLPSPSGSDVNPRRCKPLVPERARPHTLSRGANQYSKSSSTAGPLVLETLSCLRYISATWRDDVASSGFLSSRSLMKRGKRRLMPLSPAGSTPSLQPAL